MSSDARRHGLAAVLLLAFSLSACGKKGPPLAPVRFVPAPTRGLAVEQQGQRLLLTFPYPKVTPSGVALGGITGIEVWEVTRPVPAPAAKAPAAPTPAVPTPAAAAPAAAAPTAAPAPAAPAPAGATTPAATPAAPPPPPAPPTLPGGFPPLDPREFTGAEKMILKLAAADVGAATAGDRLVIALPVPSPLPEKPLLHYYRVRTIGPRGDRSEPSTQTAIVPKVPPAAPTDVTLTAKADGVEVAWKAPAPAAVKVEGWIVYRRDSQAKTFLPIHAVEAAQTSYLDTSAVFGQSYIYAVTAAAERTPLIESAIQSEVEIKYLDRFPPPAPREPVALVEAGKVRVVWRSSSAPDLAGYVVYRRDPQATAFRRLTEKAIPDLTYTDDTVAAGATYTYRVTAVDQAGNESEPAEVQAAVR
ncbi:MAG TPA: hypothetical protein VOA87_07065 [Thermoanaerobaculia bacterium]|nr:hypothetical protein [Thermoanaerobaculia bacterium]